MKKEPAATKGQAAALCASALAAHRAGKTMEAEEFLKQAMRADASYLPAHLQFANLLRDTKRYALAEKGYRYAITQDTTNAQAWSELGRLYFLMRRESDATECFRRAVKHDPRNETAHVRLIDVLERCNKTAEAEEAITTAKALFPDSPGVIFQEAKLLRRGGRTGEAVARMEVAAAWLRKNMQPANPFYTEFFYELGQLHDQSDAPAKAFACWKAAKAGQSAGSVISGESIARLKRDFTPLPPSPPLDDGMKTPLFLVGFPRSGTTLLSQILASHPDIYASEEGPAVDNMARYLAKKRGLAADGWWQDAQYPACLADITADDIDTMRRIFFAVHAAQGSDAKKILVDKMPLNMLHVPLILRVFPEAKFILALRHPCDAVLSSYMQRFELNAGMARFLDLGDAARFYDEVFSLWEFYGQKMAMQARAVRYEDIVAEFEPTIAGLLAFTGAAWHDSVLEYDKTAREKQQRILTPSYRQVSEKIYSRSNGRWRKYRPQLEAVLDILAPHAKKLGYGMDEA